jgi:putative NADH-flavin reductase
MKVIVLGAGGRLGSRVLEACVRAGHQTTAYVRSRQRLHQVIGDDLLGQVAVLEGDVLNSAQLREAMQGQEAAVQVGRWCRVSCSVFK